MLVESASNSAFGVSLKTALGKNIVIPEAMELIKNVQNSHLAQMAQACLNSVYFLYDEKFYEQTDGATMGSPLPLVAAILYMEHFEKNCFRSGRTKADSMAPLCG